MSEKVETVQYNVALGITGAFRRASKGKLYQQLGLESLKERRWLWRVSYFYDIISTKLPPYLYEIIPPLQRSHQYPGSFQTLSCGTTLFQNLFLLFTITEWTKLDFDIKNTDFHAMLRKKLLTSIRPQEKDTYGIYDPLGVKLLNKLRLGSSHLR